jgi:hypothetical protein
MGMIGTGLATVCTFAAGASFFVGLVSNADPTTTLPSEAYEERAFSGDVALVAGCELQADAPQQVSGDRPRIEASGTVRCEPPTTRVGVLCLQVKGEGSKAWTTLRCDSGDFSDHVSLHASSGNGSAGGAALFRTKLIVEVHLGNRHGRAVKTSPPSVLTGAGANADEGTRNL